jgi:predicted Zn finger-like uncharacterized protein
VEKVITQCPHCSKKYKLGNDKVGKKIRCPNCKGVFEVQEVAAKPKAVPKPAMTETSPRPRPSKPEAAPVPPVAEAPPAPPIAEQQQSASAAQEVVPLGQRPRPLKVKDFMETQHMRFLPEKAQGVDIHVSYTFVEKGKEAEYWTVKIQNGICEFTEGSDPSAKSKVKMKPDTYLRMATNQLDPKIAFVLGKMKIKGDKMSVASLRQCFDPPNVSKDDI